MEKVKNIYILLGTVLVSGSLAFADKKDKALQSITSTVTEVFGKDNLFDKKNEDINSWDNLLNTMQSYVDESAGNNKKLLDAFAFCQDVSYQLLNTLKVAYNSIFAVTSPSPMDIIRIRGDIEQLSRKGIDLKEASERLESEYYLRQKKKGVQKVIVRLMLALELAIDKLARDFKKQVDKRGF